MDPGGAGPDRRGDVPAGESCPELVEGGSCYTARDTRAFARDIGLVPRTTPVSPRPDAQTVIEQLPGWLAHYNDVHPHRALGYRSPREYIAQTREAPSGL
jgi:putative transposase